MSISIQCNQCGKGYKLPDDKGGKSFKCRECDAVVNIPRPASSGEDDWMDDDFGEADLGTPISKNAGRARAATGKGKNKSRKRKSGKSAAPAIYISIGVGVLAVGVAVGIVLFTRGGDTKPEDNSTSENIAANGAPKNNAPKSTSPANSTKLGRSTTTTNASKSNNTSGSTSSGGSSARSSPPTVSKPDGLTQYLGVDDFHVAKRGQTILTYRRRKSARNYRGKKIPARSAEILIWNWKTGQRITRLDTSENWDHFVLAPNDELAATIADISGGKEIVIWDATTGKRLKVVKSTSSPAPKIEHFNSVVFSHNGKAVYSCGSWNNAVGKAGATRLHQFARIDVASGKIAVFHAESFNPMSPMPLAASPVEDMLAIGVVQRGPNGKSAGFIEFRAGPTGEVKRKISLSEYPANVTYTPDGRRLVVLLGKARLAVINTRSGKVETTISPPVKGDLFGVPRLPVSPDGRYAHFGSRRSKTLIRELWDLQTKRVLQLNKGISREFDFLPDGRAVFKHRENSVKIDGATLYRLRFAKPENLMSGGTSGVSTGSR